MERSLTMVSIVVGLVIVLLFSGCAATNEPTGLTDKNNQTKNDAVIAAPLSLFISEGSTKYLTFRNHDILINYLSASPQHTLEITMDNVTESITISHNLTCVGKHCQYHQVIDGLEFLIEPVIRTDDTWSAYTWNTDELYIEIDAPTTPTQQK
jgi:hypothetical protein